MTIENAKLMIHQLANQLTVIMGNLELALLHPDRSSEHLEKHVKLLVKLSQSCVVSPRHSRPSHDAHTAALLAAKEAEQAAIAAGVAVEQAESIERCS
jgi:hypothetical protein